MTRCLLTLAIQDTTHAAMLRPCRGIASLIHRRRQPSGIKGFANRKGAAGEDCGGTKQHCVSPSWCGANPGNTGSKIRNVPGVRIGDRPVAKDVRKSHAVSNGNFRSALACRRSRQRDSWPPNRLDRVSSSAGVSREAGAPQTGGASPTPTSSYLGPRRLKRDGPPD
jgi:hypothetical protein